MKRLQQFSFLTAIFVSVAFAAMAQLPFRLQQNYFTGLSTPVFLTNADDGMRRIFIVQQRGIIKVAQPGSGTTTDYLNLTGLVSTSGNERGLLGLAFHPLFESNRRFFVYYTRQTDGAIEIAEYEQNVNNPNSANSTVVRIIITIPHPGQSNHNGGTIEFGPDGYLYAGTGDGGSANDPPNNAQNLNSLLGKMLRIDINTPVGQNPPYNIPPTNPFAGATPGADEIFAYGLRNPYRFSFDRRGTNQLWVGDVGQDAIEEVDIVTNGGNYGWRVYEGVQCTGIDPQLCTGGATPITQIPPVFQYSSASPDPRCSVLGGYIYRGRQKALPTGSYVYGDYCTGELFLWNNNQQTTLADTANFVSSLGEDEDGEIYVVRLGGTVDKIAGSRVNADFDGDGGSDYSVFRPGTGFWYSTSPLNGSVQISHFGIASDIPVADDYDGDGKADVAVFRSDEGVWYYLRSGTGTVGVVQWGTSGDIPIPGDFDGDRRADLTVYRPSTGFWYSLLSSNGSVTINQFGIAEDIPVNADYDGDGRDDIAVWRPSTGVWYWLNSNNSTLSVYQWGILNDIPSAGDFDGDGMADQTVYRPSTGTWYITRTSNGSVSITPWGISEDIPVVGDFDRDNRDDIAVFRPSDGKWYWLLSSTGSSQVVGFGTNGDVPVPVGDKP